jgi:hypothetical protein
MTRRAWLELDGRTIALEDRAAGYFCNSLEIGYPEVREVTNNRPDAHGLDDRTSLFGGRTVTVEITAVRGARARIDRVATSFGPFMRVDTRPELHYELEDAGGERMLVVRPVNYAWPIVGAETRDIQLQFVAADPIARDPVQKLAISHVGSTILPGRVYDKVYNRVYPGDAMHYPLVYDRHYPEPTADSTTAVLESPGDVPIRPLLRVWGPITSPLVEFVTAFGEKMNVPFVVGYRIDAGHYVEVDTFEKTAYLDGDPLQSVIDRIAWDLARWPILPAGGVESFMNLYGIGTSAVSQAQALWFDGYLS